MTLLGSACTGATGGPKTPVAQRPKAELEPEPRNVAHARERACKDEDLATPEAAVNLYVESIAANDLSCALRAYAARESATRFDFQAVVRWVMVLTPGVLKAPPEYPMFVEMNELRAKAEMAEATKRFVYGLLTDRDPMESKPVGSDGEIRAFVQAVNPARLGTLRVVRIDPPPQSNGAEAQSLFKRLATLNGADEMTDRIALYDLSGELFWSGFRFARYDKTWKIYELASSFAGPSGAGVARTTVSDYEARLK